MGPRPTPLIGSYDGMCDMEANSLDGMFEVW